MHKHVKHFTANILRISLILYIFAPAKGACAAEADIDCAQMVESVDTRDLKSLGHCGCAGSSPASSTLKKKSLANQMIARLFYIILIHY